jgi:hypothetical protein
MLLVDNLQETVEVDAGSPQGSEIAGSLATSTWIRAVRDTAAPSPGLIGARRTTIQGKTEQFQEQCGSYAMSHKYLCSKQKWPDPLIRNWLRSLRLPSNAIAGTLPTLLRWQK